MHVFEWVREGGGLYQTLILLAVLTSGSFSKAFVDNDHPSFSIINQSLSITLLRVKTKISDFKFLIMASTSKKRKVLTLEERIQVIN